MWLGAFGQVRTLLERVDTFWHTRVLLGACGYFLACARTFGCAQGHLIASRDFWARACTAEVLFGACRYCWACQSTFERMWLLLGARWYFWAHVGPFWHALELLRVDDGDDDGNIWQSLALKITGAVIKLLEMY